MNTWSCAFEIKTNCNKTNKTVYIILFFSRTKNSVRILTLIKSNRSTSPALLLRYFIILLSHDIIMMIIILIIIMLDVSFGIPLKDKLVQRFRVIWQIARVTKRNAYSTINQSFIRTSIRNATVPMETSYVSLLIELPVTDRPHYYLHYYYSSVSRCFINFLSKAA